MIVLSGPTRSLRIELQTATSVNYLNCSANWRDITGLRTYLHGTGQVTILTTGDIGAIGYLAGISTNETEFSEAGLARAVWTASSDTFSQDGTMGKKLNDASAAGNPWSAELSNNQVPGTFGAFVQRLLTVAKFLGLK